MPFPLSLVADIGGTNTRVALAKGQDLLSDTIRHFRNADFPGLEPLLHSYLSGAGALDGACVAVAGPVKDGAATLTNLDWTIDEAMLERATGATKVAVLNDLQAQGHALGQIAPERLQPVITGPELPEAVKLVIGVGTGFNAVAVHETPTGRLVPPSECGHAGLALRLPKDIKLAQYLEAKLGFAAVEDVLSGRGLERLFAFVSHEAGDGARSSAAQITAGLAPDVGNTLATEAACLFVRLLGAQTGDLALTHLPFGGIYLCGGVARALGPHLAGMGFETAFADKGRFGPLMQKFSVTLNTDNDAALKGCAIYLNQDLQM
ncbi:glucokinase (plasmid) [Pseudorhodobacter turbinis]|uniref:Glucokinase n=1 Tax=Pseudorhodobacter turbinis TaxID=2500533 RepID=A0A4P8EIS8_9RHOB|nr:glucokinase [Pseudorhodobacter turbinis]QCO56839.1 glucokinase [Pseudorhodobacter turbinis]